MENVKFRSGANKNPDGKQKLKPWIVLESNPSCSNKVSLREILTREARRQTHVMCKRDF